MDGLEELAVPSAFVAEDFGHVLVVGEEAGEGDLVDAFFEGGVVVGCTLVGGSGVAVGLQDGLDDDFSLEADAAHEPPGEDGGTVGEEALEATVRLDLFEDGVAELLPGLFAFEKRNHGRDGEEAVLDGVEGDGGAGGFDGRFEVFVGDRCVVLHGEKVAKREGDLIEASGSGWAGGDG